MSAHYWPLKVIGAATVLVVAGVALPAAAVPAGAHSPNVTLCTPADGNGGPAGPNPQYPYAFSLSTRLENTGNRSVRKSVRSVQAQLSHGTDARRPFLPSTFPAVDGRYGTQT